MLTFRHHKNRITPTAPHGVWLHDDVTGDEMFVGCFVSEKVANEILAGLLGTYQPREVLWETLRRGAEGR